MTFRPITNCKRLTTWINGQKYISLMISYELNHVAKSEDFRNELLSAVFEQVLQSLEDATPDISAPTTECESEADS